jgi:hypothetical protein
MSVRKNEYSRFTNESIEIIEGISKEYKNCDEFVKKQQDIISEYQNQYSDLLSKSNAIFKESIDRSVKDGSNQDSESVSELCQILSAQAAILISFVDEYSNVLNRAVSLEQKHLEYKINLMQDEKEEKEKDINLFMSNVKSKTDAMQKHIDKLKGLDE